jgi:2-isopropylmalate synthase
MGHQEFALEEESFLSKNRIYLFDTTLRDGEQSPGVSLNIEEKLEIAHQLARLGVDVIEAGFPITSPGDFASVQAIAKEVRGTSIAGLSRATKADIDCCWDAIKAAENPRIHIFLASSDIHLQHKLMISREEMLEQMIHHVRYARTLCPNIEFSAEDAFRSDRPFLARVVEEAIKAGAATVNLPDTVGYALPEEFGQFIQYFMDTVPNIDQAVVSVHCHNDLGLAVANSLTGLIHGARQVECAVNGIGERAGNTSLEEIIMALYTRHNYLDKEMNVQLKEIYTTSRLVSDLTGMVVQPNKAIVGRNAFMHEAGIHQDGVLKERSTYEIMNAEMLGITQNNIFLGKHSGRHAFNERLRELGYELSSEDMNQAFIAFKDLADKKKEINNQDIEALIKDFVMAVPERFTLDYLHVNSGSNIIPTATVRLTIDEKTFQAAATGSGALEAACRAIDKITDLYGKMLDYQLKSVGEGKDALGEVLAHIQFEGNVYKGRGLSTDILEASVLSYINAINRFYHEKQGGS